MMQSALKPPNLARQGKVDVRRDEDQNVKLSQTIKLLIDAGYFRARVKGLSPFDKIIGGMTWCIEVCNFDIDVDLLFHDSLTIGQKISLTERIVKVLPFMKCPYSIEPHQIQGLDAIHIYPVVQWLVALALETRLEYQDETRIIALNEFTRHYSNCIQHPMKEENLKRLKYVSYIKMSYGPKRRFKRNDQMESLDELNRPLMTLLEYSEAQGTPQLHPDSDTESIDEEDEEVRSKLQEKMSVDVSHSTRSSSQAVSSIVENQVQVIARATENYLKVKETDRTSSKELLEAMERKANEITKEKDSQAKTFLSLTTKESEKKQDLKAIREKFSGVSKEIKKSENEDLIKKEEILETLSQLLEANEAAKKGASLFKEKCRQDADDIRKQTSQITEELETEEDASLHDSLAESRTAEEQRLRKVREVVAVRTREIEGLKRLIDDVPGRAELTQYQKRFVELYSLVAAAHHETLQFYNMYNSLTDSRSYMEKESDLLNSILDNMDRGLATSSSVDEYVTQLKGIIDGIMQNKSKLESKKSEAQSERSTLSAELNRLQDLQLHYAKLLHLFSQEIASNEILLEKLER